jgi:hypothetical protein
MKNTDRAKVIASRRLVQQARKELEAAKGLLAAAKDLHEACVIADAQEELSGIVDGSFLDAVKAAIAACQPKGQTKEGE